MGLMVITEPHTEPLSDRGLCYSRKDDNQKKGQLYELP